MMLVEREQLTTAGLGNMEGGLVTDWPLYDTQQQYGSLDAQGLVDAGDEFAPGGVGLGF